MALTLTMAFSLAGLVLEHYVEQYKGLAMLTPILDGTLDHKLGWLLCQ
jgi:hypothetical protein